jgi:hypothetical protein
MRLKGLSVCSPSFLVDSLGHCGYCNSLKIYLYASFKLWNPELGDGGTSEMLTLSLITRVMKSVKIWTVKIQISWSRLEKA